jgi:hypothetical protein
MPLLVRDSLVRAGVHPDDVLTEVKHSEDEIDVLVFYRNRVFVIELKNRPVNLNDAYKLSAKTSRLESVVSKTERGWRRSSLVGRRVTVRHRITQGERSHGQPPPEGSFTPVIITTHEIAKDAVDLLRDTRDTVELLEQSEGKIDAFIQALINKIDHDDLVQRFNGLTGEDSDSVAQLAANQISRAFEFWYDAQKNT